MAPGLLDDAATREALVAHAGVRAVLDLLGAARRRARRHRRPVVGRRVRRRRTSPTSSTPREAVGEVLIAPFDLDGAFVCPELRDRVVAFDARALGRVPVAIGVGGGGEQGPADPRRAAGRHRAHARDRRRDRRGRRRPRCRDHAMPRPAGRSAAMTDAILGIDLGHDRGQGRPGRSRRPLLGLARAGYGLEVGHGPGWAEQDPGAWWSAVVGAVRALHRTATPGGEPIDIVAIGVDGHGPTLVAGRRARRGDPPGDHLPRHPRRRRGRRARGRDRHPRLGASGRCRPRSGWSATSRTARRPPRWYLTTWEWLAFRLTGEAVAPARARTRPSPTRPWSRAATGLRVDRRPPTGGAWAPWSDG